MAAFSDLTPLLQQEFSCGSRFWHGMDNFRQWVNGRKLFFHSFAVLVSPAPSRTANEWKNNLRPFTHCLRSTHPLQLWYCGGQDAALDNNSDTELLCRRALTMTTLTWSFVMPAPCVAGSPRVDSDDVQTGENLEAWCDRRLEQIGRRRSTGQLRPVQIRRHARRRLSRLPGHTSRHQVRPHQTAVVSPPVLHEHV